MQTPDVSIRAPAWGAYQDKLRENAFRGFVGVTVLHLSAKRSYPRADVLKVNFSFGVFLCNSSEISSCAARVPFSWQGMRCPVPIPGKVNAV